MANSLMLGFWRFLIPIPPSLWTKNIAKVERKFQRRLGFLTEDHRAVHHAAVRELPRHGKPLPPDAVAHAAGLSQGRVADILDELERNMAFLVRNGKGEVTWAYPVTVEPTPHRITFSSGETLYAA